MTTEPSLPTIATGAFFHAEVAETGQHVRIHCRSPDGKGTSGYLLTVPHALELLAQQLLEISTGLKRPDGPTQ